MKYSKLNYVCTGFKGLAHPNSILTLQRKWTAKSQAKTSSSVG